MNQEEIKKRDLEIELLPIEQGKLELIQEVFDNVVQPKMVEMAIEGDLDNYDFNELDFSIFEEEVKKYLLKN